MSLLADVTAALREHGTPFAVIGAAAMAVHGVTRSTRDLDLFTLERECLTPAYGQRLATAGIDVSIRPGDADDPLAGVVRVSVLDAPPVDVIVGKSPWQEPIVTAPVDAAIEGVSVPVARAADLILLKLYAGGPQDAWTSLNSCPRWSGTPPSTSLSAGWIRSHRSAGGFGLGFGLAAHDRP